MSTPADNINSNTNFVRLTGKTKNIEVTIKGGVAIEEGSIVYPDPADQSKYIAADATAGDRFGVITKSIRSTDDDFADDKRINIEIPREGDVEWEFTVGSGTFSPTDVNKYADLSDAKSVAVDAEAKKVVFITRYLSATRGVCVFAGNVSAGAAMPATS